MNRISFLLGWRYLLGSRQERSVSAMILVCFLGITIGSFALALVASVMNGFEKVTHEKMQGIHSQIIIHAEGQLINTKKIGEVLKKEFPEIAAFSPSGSGQALLQNRETEEMYNIVAIRAIDPARERKIGRLEEKIVEAIEKKEKLPNLVKHNKVIIGQKLAETIAIKTGQPITLFVSQNDEIRTKTIHLEHKHAKVSGTFKTGIDEFDSGVIFCSVPLFKKLFPESGMTQIGVRLKSNADENKTIKALRKRLGLYVHSWKDLYPALVSALKLEKYAMFLILALITLVASMNIISLMFMQISRKRADIAIFKAMGMSDSNISQTFLLIGMSIAFIGSILGLTLAFCAGWILETYPFITLPDAYYVTHLPSRMTIQIFVAVFTVVMLLSFISTWLSARRTKNVNISHVLRFEG